MKNFNKILLALIGIVLILNLFACSKQNETIDDISHLNVIDTSANYMTYSNVDAMYKRVDYVVVASPEKTYLESEQVWLNMNNERVTDFKLLSLPHSYTKRDFKVHKVIKGENPKLENIIVRETCVSDGKDLIKFEGEYVANKNNEYLLFLYKSRSNENEYYSVLGQGKFETDLSKNKQNNQINQRMLAQVQEKYSDIIK